jgi:PAS domain S-box-containing protein
MWFVRRAGREGAAVTETTTPAGRVRDEVANGGDALTVRLAEAERALEQLRKSEAYFRTLAERSADLIVRYDRQGVIEYASPTARRYGFEPHELVGLNITDLVDPGTVSPDGNTMRLKTGEPLTETGGHEFRSRCADGSWVWLQSNPSLVYDETGEVVGVVTALRDVTQKRAIEAELERQREEAERAAGTLADSEARYRLISERVRDLIVQYDQHGVIGYVSPSVRQFGLEPDQVIGRSVADFEDPGYATITLRDLADYAAGKPFAEGRLNQTQIIVGDRRIWLEGTQSAVYDDNGGFKGVVTVMRDVTRRRALEDELRAKTAAAEAASEAKSVFLASMSHEMRTPLNGVIGFATVLQTMDGIPPKARRFIDHITTSGQAMLAMVNNVLDVSKIETGHVALSPEPIDPRALVEDIVGLLREPAAAKGLAMRISFAGELPARVMADGQRLRQVLSNLLCNAVKFTDAGSITVEAAYHPEESRLRLAVVDTGVGVPEALRDRLFERFSQADGTLTRRHGGAGLGLAISKGLVTMMGGEIGMESTVGAGSTFWFIVAAPAA